VIGRRPPVAARRRLARSEHVVGWAEVTGEEPAQPLVVTNLGIWWPDGADARRIGWERIDKAVWSDETLTVVEADVLDDVLLAERPPVSVRLSQPRSVPAAVRKRVESTVARRQEIVVQGWVVRIVARRVPGRDGLVWWARLPDGLADSAAVRAEVRAAIDRFRGAEADLPV
jgi:hypothetical protein